MANSKIHVRPNGELGKCSAKIKCDFADEGAVHFEGPNAKQEADKLLEGISAYEYYKSVTTEELRESNPELAVAYGIDPDIAAFVEGKPNKCSANLAEDTEQEQTPAQEQPVAEEAPIETAPAPAVEQETVEEPKQTRPDTKNDNDVSVAEPPTEAPTTEHTTTEATNKSEDNDSNNIPQSEAYEPNPHKPGFRDWSKVYEAKLLNGEPLDPNEQKAFDTSYKVMNAINEQLTGQSVDAETFAKALAESRNSMTALAEADLLTMGRRVLQEPEYAGYLEKAIKDMDLSSFRTLDPYNPYELSGAYKMWQGSQASYHPAENLELTEAINQVREYATKLEKSDTQKSHVPHLTDADVEELKKQTAPRAFLENSDARYRQEMTERWDNNLKPGNYITFKGFDTEVYRATPNGELVSSDGKVWGFIHYDTGQVINARGNSIPTGARIYKNAEDLAKNSLPLGELGVDEARSSSDPGFFSRWESDPRFEKGYQAKIESNKYKAEKGRRNHEAALIADSVIPEDFEDMDDAYTMMKAFGYKNSQWEEKVERTRRDQAMLGRDISKFIKDGVYAGTFEYDSEQGTLVKSNREPLSAHEPKVTMDEALGEGGTIAERVSIRNAIQAKRIRLGSHVEAFSDAFESRPGLHNASSHRRRSWGKYRVSTRLAQNGNIIVSRKFGQTEPKVWIVADTEKGDLIDATEYAFPRTKLARDAKDAKDSEACILPEETIESLLAQYRSFSGSVKRDDMEAATKDMDEAYVW